MEISSPNVTKVRARVKNKRVFPVCVHPDFLLIFQSVPQLTYLTKGSITMGVGNYETGFIIGNLALDADVQSAQQLALVLHSEENPSVLFTFNDMIIGFGGLFFQAFTDSGIMFHVNEQNITFVADKDATFLGVVIPSGTREIVIQVPPGSDSFQTLILDNVWIAPHCCMTAKCTVEGIEITSGKPFRCVAVMDQPIDQLT